MTINVKQNGQFALHVINAIGQSGIAIALLINHNFLGILILFVAGYTIYRAFDVRTQVYEILIDSGVYTVFKNSEIVFYGTANDIKSITCDSVSYSIYPVNGKRIRLPRPESDKALRNLYICVNDQKTNQAQQVVAPDR